MNRTVVLDWKFAVALGLAILAVKVDAADAKEVLIHAIDACKGYAVAVTGDC